MIPRCGRLLDGAEDGVYAWNSAEISLLCAIDTEGAHFPAHTIPGSARKRIGPSDIRKYENSYEAIIAAGMKASPPPSCVESPGRRGRLKRSKARSLVEILAKLKKATMRYLHHFRVPFYSNLAERDMEITGVQQKISGTFCSYRGSTLILPNTKLHLDYEKVEPVLD